MRWMTRMTATQSFHPTGRGQESGVGGAGRDKDHPPLQTGSSPLIWGVGAVVGRL